MHEALAIAYEASVTLVAAAGNDAFDLDAPLRPNDDQP